MTPTLTLAAALQSAFDHFNAELFDGKLPAALITTARKRGARGYFHAEVFAERDDNASRLDAVTKDDAKRLDEIAMNPDHFHGRTVREILSTLVHEMAHHWQQHFGKPGKGAYHNKEWADKMRALGLPPVSKNGKGTGTCVSHDIEDGAAFDKSFARLEQVKIDWGSLPRMKPAAAQTRKKFVCPSCEQGVWGTNKNALKCGHCDEEMEPQDG